MNYEVVRNKESRHRWKDHSRRVWYYIHLKEAEKMQIDLTKVFADIGNEKENNGSDLNSNGRILLLQDKRNSCPLRKRYWDIFHAGIQKEILDMCGF